MGDRRIAGRDAAGGFTLVEAMIAMAVLLIGALGMMALHGVGLRMNSEAREVMRATAIAYDLLGQIDSWQYDDPRLANVNTANDGDLADAALAFEAGWTTPPFDFDDADIPPPLIGQGGSAPDRTQKGRRVHRGSVIDYVEHPLPYLHRSHRP